MNKHNLEFLKKVQEVVTQNLIYSDFTAADLCKKVFISRSQCFRKLKLLLGMSATAYIRQQRLKEAAKLLQSENLRVAEIGLMTGFNNLSYFAKCFKNQYGCSPSVYRENAVLIA